MKDLIKDQDKQLYRTQLGEDNDEVIIGDELSLDTENLSPKIKFSKWKGENFLSIICPDDLITDKKPKIGKTVEIGDSKIGWYANSDPDNSDNFKFGLILYEKPTTNTWSFQLEGYQTLVQDKRPSLIRDNPNGTKTFDSSGGIDKHAHSYRFYRQENEEVDGVGGVKIIKRTNHFLTILRPKFIDANGNWVWADLEIMEAFYILTVPQEFLDNAVYPVRANDEVTYQQGTDSYAGCTDNHLRAGINANVNYGTAESIKTTESATETYHTLIAFDISGIGAGATIISALLQVYCSYDGGTAAVSAYKVLKPWTETASTWNDWVGPNSEWGTAGCENANDAGTYNTGDGTDYDRFVTADAAATPSLSTWLSLDITDTISDNYANSKYYGVMLRTTVATQDYTFRSSEYVADSSLRPKLTVTYTPGGSSSSSSSSSRSSSSSSCRSSSSSSSCRSSSSSSRSSSSSSSKSSSSSSSRSSSSSSSSISSSSSSSSKSSSSSSRSSSSSSSSKSSSSSSKSSSSSSSSQSSSSSSKSSSSSSSKSSSSSSSKSSSSSSSKSSSSSSSSKSSSSSSSISSSSSSSKSSSSSSSKSSSSSSSSRSSSSSSSKSSSSSSSKSSSSSSCQSSSSSSSSQSSSSSSSKSSSSSSSKSSSSSSQSSSSSSKSSSSSSSISSSSSSSSKSSSSSSSVSSSSSSSSSQSSSSSSSKSSSSSSRSSSSSSSKSSSSSSSKSSSSSSSLSSSSSRSSSSSSSSSRSSSSSSSSSSRSSSSSSCRSSSSSSSSSYGWTDEIEHTADWTDRAKSSTTWADRNKSSNSWTDQLKEVIIYSSPDYSYGDSEVDYSGSLFETWADRNKHTGSWTDRLI